VGREITAAAHPRMTIRAVVLDLDGTCLDDKQRLHPRIRAAVNAVAARLPVIVATGRMYVSALPWVRLLGANQPLVCYEGAVVRELLDAGDSMGEILREELLGPAPAVRALQLARARDWHFQIYVDEQLLSESHRPEAEQYARVAGVPITLVSDLAPHLAGGTPKAVCVVIDPAEVERCLREMSTLLEGSARATQSRTEYVEIVNPHVNKASACEFVCERLGFTMNDAVAIGDAPNDIELLDAAGYSVAVSTARADVIAHADATCAPPQDAGVADVLAALDLV
jgi:Cof subfamily protein (haloacid dehalogenase superfamily)